MGSGDPMFGRHTRLAALGASALGVLVMAGCGAGDVDTTPYAMTETRAETAPDLMGAPPAPDAGSAPDGLLGAPTPAAAPVPVTVQPSPNKSSTLKTWRRPDGTLVTAMRPIPNPKERRAVRYAPRASSAPANRAAVASAPVAKPVAKPVTVAAAPVLKPVAPITPVAPLAKAPTPAIPAAVATKPASKLDQLQAAIAPAATKGAVLAAGDSLGKGEAGQVTLSLPATLGDMIKAEAAKLGLGKAAAKTSAYAKLEGEGYEVTPNGKQTAVVKPGEPATFAWQVKPGEGAKGQLKSEFGVDLNGVKPAQSFSLGEIVKRVAPLKEEAKKKTSGLLSKLNMPGLDRDVTLPGLGQVPMKSVLGGALVLLAVIILAIISRNAAASRAQAERRRKFRTLTDYGRNEMEPDEAPKTAHVAYVNPMVAAAGGAAAATAVSHGHDDHGHDDHAHAEAHGHEDHAHGDHGPEAHAHDDHGHADHGHDHHAHPEPHAPAEHVAHVSPVAAVASHTAHDDHGHDAHAHDAHAHGDHAHDAHASGDHAAEHGHDAHADEAHAHGEPAHGDHGHDPHHGKTLEHAHH
ncbi:MAG: hypothetical protein B7Y78_02085 [Caulobacter sp. 35-67-4]|nr:MAG: hypothetical protein B7Y81_13200 [Caulobacter sp. 32-67-35]OYX97372.1 MAG: hypothetical protein B7Y78_02085 [Caulobacter sp. 35-67-4]